MSLSVGRCLWQGVGETQRPDRGVDDERARAANVLRRPQFADAGVSSVRSLRWEWGEYGRVYSLVPNALSRLAVSFSLGWGELSSGGRNAKLSRAAECRLGRGRLESHLCTLCSECARAESYGGRVAQGEDAFTQTVCTE